MTTTEPPLPVPEDDALDTAASAVVDGTATPEEAELVAAGPEGQARVAALRAAAEAVGRPVPEQGADAAARALAAATAAFDGATSAGPHGGARDASVIGLPPPTTSSPWLRRLGAVAAVLVLLAGIGTLAVGLFGNRDKAAVSSSRSGDAALAADSTVPGGLADPQQGGIAPEGRASGGAAGPGGQPQANAGGPGAAGGPGGAAGSGPAANPRAAAGVGQGSGPGPAAPGTPPTPPPPVINGGDFGNENDVDALARRAAGALDGPPDPATTGGALPSDVQSCVNVGSAGLNENIGALRYWAVGVFQGLPVVVVAYDREVRSPPHLLLVLTRNECGLRSFSAF